MKRTSGLTLRISSLWVETAGYRPVTIDIVSVPPAASDRNLQFELTPSTYQTQREGVKFSVTVPEGSVNTRVQVPVPQSMMWQRIELTTYEDGRQWKELSGQFQFPLTSAAFTWSESSPTLLVIDSDAPVDGAVTTSAMKAGSTEQTLPALIPLLAILNPTDDLLTSLVRNNVTKPDDADLLAAHNRISMFGVLPPAALPETRVEYSSVMIILVSYDELAKLVESAPAKWSAIRDHLVSGGTMIVTGCEGDADKRRNIDEWLDGSTSPGENAVGTDREWQAPSNENYREELISILHGSNYVEESLIEESEGNSVIRPREPARFVRRDAGFGVVVALDDVNLADVSERQWSWLFKDLGPERWSWMGRCDVSRIDVNSDFWDVAVPGVGISPVMPFLGLITLFVLFIGPINYMVLNRLNRLYLLLVTVPLGAFVVTLSLYSYAFIRDGIGTTATVRSFTRILPDGRSVSWSRQSYYAGLPSSDGLIYPRDAFVIPYDWDPAETMARLRWIHYEKDRLRLAPGYLSARSICQVMVNHVSDEPMSIKITASDAPGVACTNELGMDLKFLLVFDNDRVYVANGLAAGETVSLSTTTLETARELAGEAFDVSEEFTGRGYRARSSRRRYYYGNVSNVEFDTHGIMEQEILAMLARLRSDAANHDRCYFAIVDQAPASVPLGVTSASQVASVHMIHGNW
ncbi:MAG: hypothetical protein KDB23_14670 [Planctomycetales bacterium]|nr:hypothetical protein [Planctomycetales bacterium]